MIDELETIEIDYETSGAVADEFGRILSDPYGDVPREVLVEGPAGTGKSRLVLEFVNQCCIEWPGIRVLFLREVRATLAESVLVEWEEEVLGPGHPAINGDAQRQNRMAYTYPEGWNPYKKRNGRSHVVIGGLDKPSKTFSTQYDLIILFEAIESTLDKWVKLPRANRNNWMPFQLRVAETNPGAASHWLNLRPDEDKDRYGQYIMKRLLSRHKDNPVYWNEAEQQWTKFGQRFIDDLEALPGATRMRMYEGKWVAEEGLVWPQFDRAVHCISKDDIPDGATWIVGSMDFGYNNPGCLLVWAVDDKKRAYCVAEVYRTGWTFDDWAKAICELDTEFTFSRIIADCANPDDISGLNRRLANHRSLRDIPSIVQKCHKRDGSGKKQLFGLDHVREALDKEQPGGPRMFFVNDRQRFGLDKERSFAHLPTNVVQEIESYSFLKHEDGKPDKEHPDPACSDHGCDAARYLSTWLWVREKPKVTKPVPEYAYGTYGWQFHREEPKPRRYW